MSARDPETGQFVSTEDGDRATRFEDLEPVHVEQTARFNDAPAGTGANRKLEDIDLQRTDTLALNHDEMAELVAIDVRSYRMYVDDNDFTGNYNARGAMSIAINYDDLAWIRDNDLETDNLGASGELAGRTRLEDDARLLWWGTTTFMVGDSSDLMMPPSASLGFQHLRQRFGQGPLVDSNDSLTHAAFIRTVNTSGAQNLVQLLDWTGYFDVFEVERLRRR